MPLLGDAYRVEEVGNVWRRLWETGKRCKFVVPESESGGGGEQPGEALGWSRWI